MPPPAHPSIAIADPAARAPWLSGFATGRRGPLRRTVARAFASATRLLRHTPPGAWMHGRLHGAIELELVGVGLAGAAAALHGLRVAWISDLHAGHFMDELDLHRLFERVAQAEPDLVCLGGDLINTHAHEALLLREPLRRLAGAPLGVWAVPGNHEYYDGSDLDVWRGVMEESGVEVLVNRGARVERGGASLWVAGVDDLVEGEPDLERALAGRTDGEPTLLLAHNPDCFHESAAAGVGLTLSGHTHGGQIRVFGWSPMLDSARGFVEGLYRSGDALLYVGRGAGVTVLPLRWGTRGEVTVLELRAP